MQRIGCVITQDLKLHNLKFIHANTSSVTLSQSMEFAFLRPPRYVDLTLRLRCVRDCHQVTSGVVLYISNSVC